MLELVCGLVVLLAWLVAFVAPLPLKIPALITIVALAIVALARAVRFARRWREARAFERAIAAPGAAADLTEVQRKLAAALDAIGRGGRAAYRLPWFALIGPPGSGKTTAIRGSGLELPHEKDALRGLGGTRNCDAWLTNDAILVDTAGRWTSRDEDQAEWLGFLDLLRRHRPKRPLDGLLCAIDVAELSDASQDDRAALARRVRERIDEVQSRLQMSLPVYLILTKADLLPGFAETFRALDRKGRDQIWGYTAPLSDGAGARLFGERFDELVGALEHRAPARMQAEPSPIDRALIHQFPERVAALRPVLAALVEGIFFSSIYAETPRLRGAYLTSGTQVSSAPAEEPKSYFLRDLFEQIVFRDFATATRSPREIARQRRVVRSVAAAIAVLAVATATLPAFAWSRRRAYLDETRSIVDQARASRVDGAGPSASIEALAARVSELGQARSLDLFGDDLYEPLRDCLVATLRTSVVAPIVRENADAMRANAAIDAPDARLARTQYARLELHLLLTNAEAGEPRGDDPALQSFLVDRLSERWLASVPAYDHARRARSREALRLFVERLASDPSLRLPRDEDAVTRTRRQLAAHDGLDFMLGLVVEDVEPLGYDRSVRGIVGPGAPSVIAARSVRGAFTRRGFEDRVGPALAQGGTRWAEGAWVLGVAPPANEREARERMDALRARYFEQYGSEWRAFLDSIAIRAPAGPDGPRALRTELRDERPFDRLARAVEEDTSVTPELAREFGGLVAFAPRSEISGPSDSTRYNEWLDFLLIRQGGPDYEPTRLQARADTESRITRMDPSWQARWRALLMPALDAE